jgi:hypothetical protein
MKRLTSQVPSRQGLRTVSDVLLPRGTSLLGPELVEGPQQTRGPAMPWSRPRVRVVGNERRCFAVNSAFAILNSPALRHTTLALMLLLGLAGCNPMSAAMTGAQMGAKVFTGAQAKLHLLEGLSADAVRPYRSVASGQVTTDVPAICTFEVMSALRIAMKEALASDELRRHFPGGDPRLVVNTAARFFKEGSVYGKEPRLDLLVTFVDGADGREIGKVYIEGISQSPLETKARHLAKADAEAVARLLRHRKEGKAK